MMSSPSSAIYIKFRHLLKTSLAYTAYMSGMTESLAAYRTGIKNQRRIIMLGYHRMVEDFAKGSQHAIPSLLISTGTFRRQLDLILKKFDCLSLDEAMEALSGRRQLHRDAVVLTFDDGYRDFYDLAFPVLRAYGLPATIYVTTGLVGTDVVLLHDQIYYLVMKLSQRNISIRAMLELPGLTSVLPEVRCALTERDYFRVMRLLLELPRPKLLPLLAAIKQELNFIDADFPADYQMLNWEMLKEMTAAGITIGAHTHSHVLLTSESAEVAEREIRASKTALENGLGVKIDHFAYPDGRYNDQVVEMVRAAGFTSACTIEDRPNTLQEDPFRLKRKILWEHTCMGIFGSYSNIIAECQLRGLFANPAYKLRPAAGELL